MKREFTGELRLVGRRPEKVNDTDRLFAADLLNPRQTCEAVQGSTIVCDDNRLTFRQFIGLAADALRVPPRFVVRKRWQLALATLVSRSARDVNEMLPRYAVDNVFVFKARFPQFRVTTFQQGLAAYAEGAKT